jgi:hypothetical protein
MGAAASTHQPLGVFDLRRMSSIVKVDLKKELKHLYRPSAQTVSVVNIPSMNFLMIDGTGDPNTSPLYAQAVEALFASAYALKFKIKKGGAGIDYAMMPLEGLWWTEDMSQFTVNDKQAWQWTMMILQPDYITADLFAKTLPEVEEKRNNSLLRSVRFEAYHEGTSAQIMHKGSYAEEGPTIAALHDYIVQNGKKLRGKHHEIYLNDPRKTQPAKLQTIIRQPFQ